MFQQDYLMKLIMQFIQGIQRSMERASSENDEGDPESAADLLEATIGVATEIDGGVLLSLSPDSIASVLQVSGTDPGVAEYIGRTMFLESDYLVRAGRAEDAQLRLDQARALADAYGFELSEGLGGEGSMRQFLQQEQAE